MYNILRNKYSIISKYIIILFIFISIGITQFSCNRNKKINSEDISSQELVYNKMLVNSIKLSHLFNKYEFILLKSSDTTEKHIIGKINKLIVSENRMVIFDKEITNKVFVYDTLGNFIFSPRRGGGPKEVKKIDDFCVNYVQDRLLVLDNGNRAIKVFSLTDGGFLKNVPVGALFDGIAYLSNNTVLLTNNGLTRGDKQYSINMKVIKLDNSKVVNSYSLIGDKSSNYLFYSGGNSTFLKSDSAVYFSPPYSNMVYMISKNTGLILKSLLIDFGKKSLAQYSEKISSARDLSKYLSKSAYLTGYSGAISDKYIIYPIANSRNINYLFIDKSLSSCKSYEHIENDLYSISILPFVGYSDKGAVYLSISAESIGGDTGENSKIISFLQKRLGKEHINWNLNPILVKLWNK